MATSLSSCTLLSVPRPQYRLSASRGQPQRRPFSSASTLRRCQRESLVCQAAKGFAPDSKSSSKNDRPTRAVVLKDKSVVMLYKVDSEVYCSDANSTAFQFPLTDAKIASGESGPTVEVPLDGTVYDLQTGKVLEWCPKNNLIRKVLGSIKSAQQPKKLKVYPTQVDEEGNIFAKFYTAA